MKIGMIGLGRMGLNMARRLVRGGIEVVAYNRTVQKAEDFAAEEGKNAAAAQTMAELVSMLPAPRIIWLMLPAGGPTDEHVDELLPLLSPGDTIVDGGNTMYRDDLRRHKAAGDKGIRYCDAGVSGGIWGLAEGYCIMVGGEPEVVGPLKPALDVLTGPGGNLHTGPIGSGHFVKMVHNGIEYGMMQAYAEGFEILAASQFGEDLDFPAICDLWNHGSVVRSWLLELAQRAFTEDRRLESLKPYVDDSGEGRWTVNAAVETAVSAPVITMALFERFRSRQDNSFQDRVLAALRNQFGGHAVKKRGE
ncbi:6-phosphogluconate dehydrogenase, decarboxylating [Solidesulfovibrio fructosivorans JJ]]|uniref:6-phosphogluconate dehydrogenase, decarboxylating n=1 Tax=Solidesulfovibrio fructosivorans JJ] TaxID=596151 RepID=E1JSC0_SOLFR|nr:decarboxylating 6-phosphogluconate dehydrogenase [Solidesulfovibrio fructosivorans]EFL52889.1 6-phosphogluconate dehydrogenase, decarboxylating [Solidesulfovibrio fructosivorans JJ]]